MVNSNQVRHVVCNVVFSFMAFLPQSVLAENNNSDPLETFPVAIRCEMNKVHHIFYLSKVDENGVATYISPGRLAGTITVDGTAKRVGGDQTGSCKEKTLEELRAFKQTINIQR